MTTKSSSSSKNIGYKSVGDYIVTLKLPNNCKTDEKRKNVVNHEYAVFRCNVALVIDIRHKFTNQLINSVQSEGFVYKQGETIKNDYYNDDEENYDHINPSQYEIRYYK